jgi:purine-binding chemotaxis protein CheW
METYEVSTNVNVSYLVVSIDNEKYALHVSNVINILEMSKITSVPQSPDYMKGVMDLRGAVLPVIDTRLKLGLTATEYTPLTCVVVVNFVLDGVDLLLGILVDKVEAVEEIENEFIKPAPSIGYKYKSTFITGVASLDDDFVMVLDIVELFNTNEIEAFKQMVGDIQTSKNFK